MLLFTAIERERHHFTYYEDSLKRLKSKPSMSTLLQKTSKKLHRRKLIFFSQMMSHHHGNEIHHHN